MPISPLLRLTAVVLASAILVAATEDRASAQQITGTGVTVVDGDTLRVSGVKIRIHGIDAPETRQGCLRAGRAWPCGAEATRVMGQLAEGAIRCEGIEKDRYGRTIAKCISGEVDVGRELVRRGLALAYRRYSLDYVQDEDYARRNRLGMWAGEFEAPWDWRRR
jgi:endonuclease YncB( thermonuclease family)